MSTKKRHANGSSNGSANGSTNGVAELEPIQYVTKPGKSKVLTSAKRLIDSPDQHVSAEFDNKELLKVLTEVRNGNFTVRMPIDQTGISGKICDTLNEIISLNEKMMDEFTHAGNTIGKQGKLTQRIE